MLIKRYILEVKIIPACTLVPNNGNTFQNKLRKGSHFLDFQHKKEVLPYFLAVLRGLPRAQWASAPYTEHFSKQICDFFLNGKEKDNVYHIPVYHMTNLYISEGGEGKPKVGQ